MTALPENSQVIRGIDAVDDDLELIAWLLYLRILR